MIAIGALGGSGTRAVAEVLIQAGFYLGDDLNESNDNLIFTRLFKNPDWFKEASVNQRKKRMDVFEKYMLFKRLSIKDFYVLFFAAKTNPTIHSKASFYFQITKRLFCNGKLKTNWGWKEPNTQIYMCEFLDYFDELKYIHVLRHGLDMAFSNNKQQLNNWGWKYNIVLHGNENDDELANKQLDYWINSTKDIMEKSKKYNNRFLLINHESFCQNPKYEIDKMLVFSGINISPENVERLYTIPKNTGSNNRYKQMDLSIFDDQKLQFVKDMGFEI
ncbi:MAG: sulfotransferase domain-containing protein [Marinilabiliaceae bacterium]|nr:sulfotransferase domain-containing protein [Marinilabiliaceae bacterium]